MSLPIKAFGSGRIQEDPQRPLIYQQTNMKRFDIEVFVGPGQGWREDSTDLACKDLAFNDERRVIRLCQRNAYKLGIFISDFDNSFRQIRSEQAGIFTGISGSGLFRNANDKIVARQDPWIETCMRVSAFVCACV